MRKEKIIVTDYFSNEEYEIFLRRKSKGGTTTQKKITLYYSQNTSINIGTIFTLRNIHYIITNQDADESGIFYRSIAVKCDSMITIKYKNKYTEIPVAIQNDDISTDESHTINLASGTVVLFSSLNDISSAIKINDQFYVFGNKYKVGNSFQNEGIIYFYMTQENSGSDTFSLIYDGDETEVDLSIGTYQLKYQALKNESIVNNPELTYEVDNTSIASVSADGLLTLNASGTVNVTAIWIDGNNTSCITTMKIKDANEPGRIAVSGTSQLKLGVTRTYTANYYNNEGTQIEPLATHWEITCPFDKEKIIQNVIEPNEIELKINDENLADQTFVLTASNESGNFESGRLSIKIVPLI